MCGHGEDTDIASYPCRQSYRSRAVRQRDDESIIQYNHSRQSMRSVLEECQEDGRNLAMFLSR